MAVAARVAQPSSARRARPDADAAEGYAPDGQGDAEQDAFATKQRRGQCPTDADQQSVPAPIHQELQCPHHCEPCSGGAESVGDQPVAVEEQRGRDAAAPQGPWAVAG